MAKKKVSKKSVGSLDEYLAGRPKVKKAEEVVETTEGVSLSPAGNKVGSQIELMNLLKKAQEAVEDFTEDEKNVQVIQSFPMKDAWRKRYLEMEEIAAQGQALMNRLNTYRKHFWSSIEMETGIFDNAMRINEKTGMIEVIDMCDEK